MYAELAQFGIKAVSALSGSYLAEANARAANVVNEANAYANNLTRTANNQLAGARASLARNTQSVNNQRTLQTAGSQAEAALVNYRRARDSATQDDFETQLQMAEQAGAQAAAGAFSGLSGGVVDLVAGTTALRKQRVQQRAVEAMGQANWDASKRQRQIMMAGYDSLDFSEIHENLDQSVDVAVKQRAHTSILMDLLGSQDPKGMANIADGLKSKFSFSAKPTNSTGVD